MVISLRFIYLMINLPDVNYLNPELCNSLVTRLNPASPSCTLWMVPMDKTDTNIVLNTNQQVPIPKKKNVALETVKNILIW